MKQTYLNILETEGSWNKKTLKIAGDRKGMYKQLSVVADIKGVLSEVITVRWFRTPNARTSVHCAVYINYSDVSLYRYGGDYASGYGFDRERAAFDVALGTVGFEVMEEGRNIAHSLAPEYVLAFIAEQMGFVKFIVVGQ